MQGMLAQTRRIGNARARIALCEIRVEGICSSKKMAWFYLRFVASHSLLLAVQPQQTGIDRLALDQALVVFL